MVLMMFFISMIHICCVSCGMVDVCGMTSLDVCGIISQYMFAFAKRKNSDTICTQWDKSGTICTPPKSGDYTI